MITSTNVNKHNRYSLSSSSKSSQNLLNPYPWGLFNRQIPTHAPHSPGFGGVGVYILVHNRGTLGWGGGDKPERKNEGHEELIRILTDVLAVQRPNKHLSCVVLSIAAF